MGWKVYKENQERVMAQVPRGSLLSFSSFGMTSDRLTNLFIQNLIQRQSLNQGLANFFLKVPESTHFRLSRQEAKLRILYIPI